MPGFYLFLTYSVSAGNIKKEIYNHGKTQFYVTIPFYKILFIFTP